jgi:hypothetical protein
VTELIGRFPQKEEYVVTTSEFDRVKARLIAVSATPDRIGTGSGSDEPRRPTLKRRSNTDPGGIQTPDPMDPNTQPDTANPQSTPTPAPNRPVLTRRDSDTDAPPPNP